MDDATQEEALEEEEKPPTPEELKKFEKLEKEKQQILRGVADAKVDTLQQRIAWILNHYPEARDSDVTCQLKYWAIFDKELYNPSSITPDDLYKLTRLTSVARSRAKIQNVHKLFLASPEVRKRRGKLEEEEKQKALKERPSYPVYAVYADESGKTAQHLIVGSMWILNGIETLTLVREIEQWREKKDFHSEFHFKAINKSKLPLYLEIIDIIKARSAAISFKALSVERRGISDINKALTQLYLNLLVKGIEHEDSTSRAPLPRSIQLWKDSEEPGSDKLMLEEIRNRLREMSSSIFDSKLVVDDFQAVDSKSLVLVQLADLFTSSVNRSLNATGEKTAPKDEFARAMLKEFGMNTENESISSIGDCSFYTDL